ncbi:MAG: hypothetical protein DRR19_03815 [Candidatus Parabeggiatoa sp. nov. 1]|nr:MAG: hypothetical protein DRR19_03815 [Gammaproteobacteria bacterium]
MKPQLDSALSAFPKNGSFFSAPFKNIGGNHIRGKSFCAQKQKLLPRKDCPYMLIIVEAIPRASPFQDFFQLLIYNRLYFEVSIRQRSQNQ